MNRAAQKICVWAGPVMLVLWIVSFVFLCRFIPPPAPSRSALEIQQMFLSRTGSIRAGLYLTMIASALLVPYAAVISTQLRRIEGIHHVLAGTQLASGALLSLEFIIPVMLWQVAAYRPAEVDPSVTRMLNDAGWILFVSVVSSAVVQITCIAIAILLDRNETPIFPRWAGYFNAWVALLIMPAGVLVFFKGGPLAWNGLLAFYLPLTAFAVWFPVMTTLLLKAVNRQTPAHADTPGARMATHSSS